MTGTGLRTQRLISVVAGTLVALACGTNVRLSKLFPAVVPKRNTSLTFIQYAYSAWAPQFAERMKLSSTESNLIVSSSHR